MMQYHYALQQMHIARGDDIPKKINMNNWNPLNWFIAIGIALILAIQLGVISSPIAPANGIPPTQGQPIINVDWDDFWAGFYSGTEDEDAGVPPEDEDVPPEEPPPEEPPPGGEDTGVEWVMPTDDDVAGEVLGVSGTEWANTWWYNHNQATGESYDHADWYCQTPSPDIAPICDTNMDCIGLLSPDGYPTPYCWTSSGLCCIHFL